MARILFFGRLQDVAQTGARDMAVAGGTSLAKLIGQIAEREPHLGAALGDGRIRYAVNGIMVGADHVLDHGDEIAFLPPVSGG